MTVSAPLPSGTDPLPERTNPLLRLMDVPLMVPWQLTGSLIVPVPPKPWPANRLSGVPAVWVKPTEVKWPKPVAGLNPAGTISSELAPMLTEVSPRFFQVPLVRSRMPSRRRARLVAAVENALIQQPAVDLERAAVELVLAAAADRQQAGGVGAAGLPHERRRRPNRSRCTRQAPSVGRLPERLYVPSPPELYPR